MKNNTSIVCMDSTHKTVKLLKASSKNDMVFNSDTVPSWVFWDHYLTRAVKRSPKAAALLARRQDMVQLLVQLLDKKGR